MDEQEIISFSEPFRGTSSFYVGFKTVSETASATASGSSSVSQLHTAIRTASASATSGHAIVSVHTSPRGATGSGSATAGDQAIGLHTAPRQASASANGDSTSAGLHTAPRSATGSGTGSSSNLSEVITFLRAASASGGATAGDSAIGLHIAPRGATGSGQSSESSTRVRTAVVSATGSATSGSTAIGLHTAPRTATADGTSSESATRLIISPRSVTGSGNGDSFVSALHTHLRAASASGSGTSNNSILYSNLRTAQGSGSATAGDTALILHHLHLELVHQTTPFYIQISELLKALVRQRLVTKHLFFILHSELHLQVEQAQRVLKKKAHSLEQLPLTELALQPQMSCALFLELLQQQDNLVRFHRLDTENSELHLQAAAQQRTMKLSFFIPQSEQQAEMGLAHQANLHSRLLLEQQAQMVMVQTLLMACIQLREMQAVLEKAIHLHRLLLRLSELLQGLELAHQITRFCIQISEQPKVLVRLLLAMKPLGCIPHLEQQLVKELVVQAPQSFIAIFVLQVHQVVRQLQTKQLAYILLQEVQLVLELEIRTLMSSRFYLEQHHLMVNRRQMCFSYALLLVLQMAPVRAANLYPSNLEPSSERQMVKVQVVQATLPFMGICVRQLALVLQRLATKRMVYTLHREMQVEMELVHHQ